MDGLEEELETLILPHFHLVLQQNCNRLGFLVQQLQNARFVDVQLQIVLILRDFGLELEGNGNLLVVADESRPLVEQAADFASFVVFVD